MFSAVSLAPIIFYANAFYYVFIIILTMMLCRERAKVKSC